ncbi:AAA family ATPase [Actinokineospora sp. UTMC 2448]|uniref:AAA family ATPase n=1 Tax=Actinokineospora sp. UTMC 2448 TaxID=2268449 RepID=UPI002164E50D|nr:AAA family ATPase [Actinokineospora sp. UTMC 2448]UVS80998.1 recombination protein F [Actinokineospora sp. UTMC 2448]
MPAERTLDRFVRDHLADSDLPEAARNLVIAALDGDDAVEGALGGASTGPGAAVAAPGRSPEVYLAAVRVRGFRGIGEQVELTLPPRPGLTLVTGRNGSAKSSIAEAVEVALTRRNSRWAGKADSARKLWQAGWRNLHSPSTAIEVETVAGGETAVFRASWPEGAAFKSPEWTGRDWDFETHRPFLSYTDLGRLVDGKPAELHDVLHRALGLERLDEARARLGARRLELDRVRKAVRDEKNALGEVLRGIDDDRAREAVGLLTPTRSALARLTALAVGDAEGGLPVGALRSLVALSLPSADEVAAAVAEVRAAADAVTAAVSALPADLDDLLGAALAYHDGHGDGACPVCGGGALDAAWRARVEQARRSAKAQRAARAEHAAAVSRLRRLVGPPPAVLDAIPEAAFARAAWADWADADDAVAAHAALENALAKAREWAAAELASIDEVWRPTALRLAAWAEQAGRVLDEHERHRLLSTAEDWLKAMAGRLRDERMRPFAEQTARLWAILRKDSNVSLDGVALAGAHTRRRTDLNASVDGADAPALGVLSQGELHALALALFLPRTRVDDSPFRFVLLDDPVQALDSAKVDGLAEVLADVAATRQVVVFTHDDRLARSVRAQGIPATVWEVVRGERSRVTLRTP